MSESNRVFLSTLAGALLGAAAGYLYFTNGGRRMRSQLEPKLEEAMHEVQRLRGTVARVQSVASEGWRSLTQLAGESRQGWGRPGQTSPF